MSPEVLSGKRVLIVEDQYLIADEMRRAVEGLGGQPVGPCAGVESARSHLAGEPLDLALLDINLAGDEVFPLADDLMAGEVPIIFATGYDNWMIPDRYDGCARVQKPVTRAVLEAAIRRFLEKR